MKRIRLLVWKEFLQLRRDPLLLRALMLMPIIQLVLFGYVVAADVKNLATAVIDLDHTPVSRKIEASFASSGYFVIDAHPGSEADLQPLMDTGKIRVAVVIGEGTQAALDRGESAPVGIIVDGSDASVASVAAGYASRIIATLNSDRVSGAAGTASENTASGTHGGGAPVGVDARVRVLFNPTLAAVNTMVPGLIGAILLISVSVIMSQAVVRERERGNLEQMFVTPITPVEYLVGKVIPYALLASVQALIVALVGVFWFKVPFNGSLAVVVVGLGLFLLTCIGQGLLISLVSHTRHQAQQTVMLIMIPMMVLSGFIFPIESMPDQLQPMAWAIPLTWALTVLRSAIIKGSGFGALAVPMLVLAGFAVVIFGAAVLATRRRLAE